jgi:hypothetical protein
VAAGAGTAARIPSFSGKPSVRRVTWFTSGALFAAIALAGGSVLLQSAHRRRADLERENARLLEAQRALAEKAERLERERRQLERVVERLGVERRMADIDVLQHHTAEDGRIVQTIIQLTEIGRDGTPLTPLVFGVPGQVPHFDALVIKFLDDYVRRGDPLRGASLALFRRVYGESQAPQQGYWLGRRGAVPDVYRVDPQPSEFEQALWREFWSYASDPQAAAEAGVRVAQGEAVYAPMNAGERWRLTLEADGGLNLVKQVGIEHAAGLHADTDSGSSIRLRSPSPLP